MKNTQERTLKNERASTNENEGYRLIPGNIYQFNDGYYITRKWTAIGYCRTPQELAELLFDSKLFTPE